MDDHTNHPRQRLAKVEEIDGHFVVVEVLSDDVEHLAERKAHLQRNLGVYHSEQEAEWAARAVMK